MDIGRLNVTLNAVGGLLANDPTFQSELADGGNRLRKDFDDIRFYPVVNLGLAIRF